MKELKKCPFCGGDAENKGMKDFEGNTILAFVACKQCGAQTRAYASVDAAKEAWNSRTRDTCQCGKNKEDGGSRWVYCGDGENLPKEPFWCIVTVDNTDPMTMEVSGVILPYQVGHGGGTWNDLDGNPIPFEVIAWTPAPKEPYHEP